MNHVGDTDSSPRELHWSKLQEHAQEEKVENLW